MTMYRVRVDAELFDQMFRLPKGYNFTGNDGTDGICTMWIRHEDGKDHYGFQDATVLMYADKKVATEVVPC